MEYNYSIKLEKRSYEMIPFKLKSIKSNQHTLSKRRNKKEVILRLAERTLVDTLYYNYRILLNATVEIQYETFDKNNILRITFQLKQKNLSITYFEWDHLQHHFKQVPLDDETFSSYPIQSILHNLNFTGEKHFSYVMNSQQPLPDLERKQ